MRRMLFAIGTLLVATAPAHAVEIGNFPGLETLIDKADAIVILRIDRHIQPNNDRNLLSTHECFIYQSLKGPIPAEERIQLRLMDTRTSFSTPFALWSTHLMFLTKKRTPDEPTEYRTIEYEGANIRLGPTGHEKKPEGDTIADKVRSIVKRSIETNNDLHAKEAAFLTKMLGEVPPPAGDAEQTNAAHVPRETTTLVGRVLYDGTPPEPRALRIPLTTKYWNGSEWVETAEMPDRRRIKDLGLLDESLVVGEDRGIANVIVWVRDKDVPAPPRQGPFPPATIRAVDGRFAPHVLAFWSAAPLKWINDSGAGINFNYQGPFNSQNRLLAEGQTIEIEITKPAPLPGHLTSNIQPWFLAYVLPLAHPYFAVTGRDGRFEIKNLPPGEWEFAMWHERSGWLETDRFPKGRFTLEIKRGTNDLAELHVDPLTFKK